MFFIQCSMNIFVTSYDPTLAAVALDDKRCGKMLVEAAQLFAASLNHHGLDHHYRISHANHPCAIWARNTCNLEWLIAHASAMATEFEYRFGKRHKSWYDGIQPYLDDMSHIKPDDGMTEFSRSCRRTDMGIDYTHIPLITDGYRLYLTHRWDLSNPRWTKTPSPWWYFRDNERASTR